MSERENTETNRDWLWVLCALLCLANIAICAYILVNFAMVPAAPLGAGPVIIALVSGVALIKLAVDRKFRQTINRQAGLVGMLLLFVLISYQSWTKILEQRAEYAAIRLDVSQICLSESEKTEATKQHCRKFVAKKGGYLCKIGEMPMTRCERRLREVADRPLKPDQP